jgi:hypothetical protein
MSLPFFIGGLTWATLALIRLSLAKLLPDPDPNIITTTIVKSRAIGVATGVLLMLFSEPVIITGKFQDKQTEQNLLSSSTIALIKSDVGMQQMKIRGLVGLGLKEGDPVKVSGVQYFTPSFRDFDAIEKVN